MTKSLGERIETGFSSFSDSIHRLIIEGKDHELEILKTGFIDDKTKVRMLKQELYRSARLDKDTAHIRTAIATLEDCIDRDLRRKRNQLNDTNDLINSLTFIGKFGLILALIWGGVILYPQACNSSNQSNFCFQSREVIQYFYTPKSSVTKE